MLEEAVEALRAVLGGWEVRRSSAVERPEAWLHEPGGEGSVGLFEEGGGVRVVVWVGSECRQHRADDAELEAWLRRAVADQRVAGEAAAAERARRAALPLPAVEEVLARLRAGESISTSGSRAHLTFFVDRDGRLMLEEFDEGWTEERPTTEAQLATSIELFPDAFRKEEP